MFAQKDLHQIAEKGILPDEIYRQIKYFQNGFPPLDICMTASPGKGIIILSEGDEKHYKDIFQDQGPDSQITRFIPASGAATRMFKTLYEALDNLKEKSKQEQLSWVAGNQEIRDFFESLESYPFYEDLEIGENASPEDVLKNLLGAEGLDYGSKPKGLLKFHKYSKEDRRSSFEEHLLEAVMYCGNRSNMVRIHMTVSTDHLEGFKSEAARILPGIEKETGFRLDLSFSFQRPETDTIAVDLSNAPFRNPDGSLLFRPGGHGALIRNLDALDSDIIFISNIDNVAPDRTKEIRVKYKQVLGGVLLEFRSKIFYDLQLLTSDNILEKGELDSMVNFMHDRVGVAVPEGLQSWDIPDLRLWLIQSMDRPIRVCGMVKNEGEPGGGPFYVRSEGGEIGLQIVESSQIDLENPHQAALLAESTHFNPVDLVCSIRDFRGNKFNLGQFVDYNTGFISSKSVGGKPLKALELPGLWNGSMAGWLTLFVDVPIETFSPVKTVFDLIREEHQV